MLKRPTLLAVSALLLILSNLRPCIRLSADGDAVEGTYSVRELEQCLRVSQAAAEEILPSAAVLPQMELKRSLSLRPPDGDAAAATGLILRHTPGVSAAELVTVDGTRLGFVEDAAAFKSELSRFISNQRPTWASSGNISGELSFKPMYTRADRLTSCYDMLLLVSGAAPVMYTDGSGYMSWA